jgi:hypothetical protein
MGQRAVRRRSHRTSTEAGIKVADGADDSDSAIDIRGRGHRNRLFYWTAADGEAIGSEFGGGAMEANK